MTEETKTATTAEPEKQAVPCFVRHEDAGGYCRERAAIRVYGLPFCEAHGEQARIGAAMEEQEEVRTFFAQFYSPPARTPIEKALAAAREHLDSNTITGAQHWRALIRAYPNPPDELVTQVREWILDEHPGYEDSVVDYLMDTLGLLHKLLRTAHEDGATWLVERLEVERESRAAQAAVALGELEEAEATLLKGEEK